MDCIVGYGSDEDYDTEYKNRRRTGLPGGSGRRKEDDTNYDDVNMDMSEDSQEESEPELPQAEPEPEQHHQGRSHEDKYSKATQRRSPNHRDEHRPSPNNRRDDHRSSSKHRDDQRSSSKNRDDHRPSPNRRDDHSSSKNRDGYRLPPNNRDDHRSSSKNRENHRERDDYRERDDRLHSPGRARGERDKRDKSPKRDDRRLKSERSRHEGSSRRGLLGDKPDDKSSDNNKTMPALMDLKPFGGDPPPYSKSQDTRDAVSPRFVDRDRDRREKDKDRERHNRRSEEKSRRSDRRSRSRDRLDKPADHRDRNLLPRPRPNHPAPSELSEKHGCPSGEFRPSTSYKVNKKLEVMEKMGLQIKTPDGSMATAQQLRQAATEPMATRAPLPYCNPTTTTSRMLDQVHKRKLLWANKTADKAAWTGATFARDDDGKQANKFMRLMGIKDPAEVPPKPEIVDPNKKQEEMFQAMQAQYDVARATTHTMRGVGLGFQRGPF